MEVVDKQKYQNPEIVSKGSRLKYLIYSYLKYSLVLVGALLLVVFLGFLVVEYGPSLSTLFTHTYFLLLRLTIYLPNLPHSVISFLPTIEGILTMILGTIYGYVIFQKLSWKVALWTGLLISFIIGLVIDIIRSAQSYAGFGEAYFAITMLGIIIGITISQIIKSVKK